MLKLQGCKRFFCFVAHMVMDLPMSIFTLPKYPTLGDLTSRIRIPWQISIKTPQFGRICDWNKFSKHRRFANSKQEVIPPLSYFCDPSLPEGYRSSPRKDQPLRISLWISVVTGDPKDPARREKTQSQTFTPLCFWGWVSTLRILNVVPSMGRTVYLPTLKWFIFIVNDGKFVRKSYESQSLAWNLKMIPRIVDSFRKPSFSDFLLETWGVYMVTPMDATRPWA